MPDIECEKYNGRPIQTILGVELDSNFFGLRLMARDDGTFSTTANMTETYPDKGITSPQCTGAPEEYLNRIRQRIHKFSHHEGSPVDLVALHGTQATRPELLDIIQAVFAENDKTKSQDYLRSTEEYTYAAARGGGPNGQRGEYMPSYLRWQRPDEEEVELKQEL